MVARTLADTRPRFSDPARPPWPPPRSAPWPPKAPRSRSSRWPRAACAQPSSRRIEPRSARAPGSLTTTASRAARTARSGRPARARASANAECPRGGAAEGPDRRTSQSRTPAARVIGSALSSATRAAVHTEGAAATPPLVTSSVASESASAASRGRPLPSATKAESPSDARRSDEDTGPDGAAEAGDAYSPCPPPVSAARARQTSEKISARGSPARVIASACASPRCVAIACAAASRARALSRAASSGTWRSVAATRSASSGVSASPSASACSAARRIAIRPSEVVGSRPSSSRSERPEARTKRLGDRSRPRAITSL